MDSIAARKDGRDSSKFQWVYSENLKIFLRFFGMVCCRKPINESVELILAISLQLSFMNMVTNLARSVIVTILKYLYFFYFHFIKTQSFLVNILKYI